MNWYHLILAAVAAAADTGTQPAADVASTAPQLPPDIPTTPEQDAQYNAAFDEDDDEAAPAKPQVQDADQDQEPAPEAEETTPEAPAVEQDQVPAAPEKETPKPEAPPAQDPQLSTERTAPEAKAPPPAPIVYDFEAAVQRVVAEPLPEKIKVGDKEINVATFLNDFPEVTAIAATIARRMVEQTVGPMLPVMHDYRARQVHEAFMDKVSRVVPEARALASSAEFTEWLTKQPKPLQQMANVYDADAAAYVLKQFTASRPPATPGGATQSRPAAKPKAPAVPSPEFERRRQIHAGTVGPKQAARAPARPDPNDYDAAFDEDDN